jgi:hypothetical protein
VDKLQVINDYGDQAKLTGVKSGDPAKVLNIVLKADKRNGEFGRVDGAGGDQGKYVDNTFVNAFNGEKQASANASISNNNPAGNDPAYSGKINYANKWTNHLDGYLISNTGGSSPRSVNTSLQETFYSGEQLQQTQDNQSSFHNYNSSLNSRLTFKPDNYSTLRVTVSGGLNQSSNQLLSNFTSLQQDSGFTKSTTGQSKNTSQSTMQNLSSDLSTIILSFPQVDQPTGRFRCD